MAFFPFMTEIEGNLTAMKRAGADMIITYHAIEAAGWITDKR